MNTQEPKSNAAGGASALTAGLGGGVAVPIDSATVLKLTSEEPWAVVSPEGVLTRFDNQTCRRLATDFDPDAPLDQNKAIARLCVALLECAATEMDHILRAGGGTQGDIIRALTITTPNVKVSDLPHAQDADTTNSAASCGRCARP